MRACISSSCCCARSSSLCSTSDDLGSPLSPLVPEGAGPPCSAGLGGPGGIGNLRFIGRGMPLPRGCGPLGPRCAGGRATCAAGGPPPRGGSPPAGFHRLRWPSGGPSLSHFRIQPGAQATTRAAHSSLMTVTFAGFSSWTRSRSLLTSTVSGCMQGLRSWSLRSASERSEGEHDERSRSCVCDWSRSACLICCWGLSRVGEPAC
mmetsp:Transcript_8611/g.35095  ORF Transcript_8611/g.35095 Transcript_8611/m.35095 type:complete len:205 (-) Transcript_8611:268-882(-)